MNPKAINPYAGLESMHKNNLDYIIAHLPVNPTFNDLNKQLSDAFFTADPDHPRISEVVPGYIQTILPNVYNGYVNGEWSAAAAKGKSYVNYSAAQQQLISGMLRGIRDIPVESIGDFLSGTEEAIASGTLSYEEQIPLFLAAALGKSDSEYWQAQMATPGGWTVYLNADNAINYMHVASWVAASMQGALLAYGLIKPPQIQFVDIISSAIGSTGMAAGKVIFGWVDR